MTETEALKIYFSCKKNWMPQFGPRLIQRAVGLADLAHNRQKYGKFPFFRHLFEVQELVKPYGEDARIVAYLHDIVEDTYITLNFIEQEFGPYIADQVDMVTDRPGNSRSERKQKTYARMKKAGGYYNIAMIVKVADRYSNMMSCVKNGYDNWFNMYQKERQAFYDAVYRKDLCEGMWERLNELHDRFPYKKRGRRNGVLADHNQMQLPLCPLLLFLQ